MYSYLPGINRHRNVEVNKEIGLIPHYSVNRILNNTCTAYIHLEEKVQSKQSGTGVQWECRCIPHGYAVTGLFTSFLSQQQNTHNHNEHTNLDNPL